MEGRKKYLIIGIVGGLLGAFLLLVILGIIFQNQQSSNQNQASAQEEQEVPFFNETFAVDARSYKFWKARVDISDKKYNRIEGTLDEKSGHGINFLILDTKNYNAWTEDNSNAMPYVKQSNVVNYDFSFIPDHSDDYFFVFDNTNSIFTNKLVAIHATWKYRQ